MTTARTLAELKQAIDDFPTIFDVDHCNECFLSPLARLGGPEVEGSCLPDCQRRCMREAVEIYCCKDTILAIEHDFNTLGWQGELQAGAENLFDFFSRCYERLGLVGVKGKRHPLWPQVASLGAFDLVPFCMCITSREDNEFLWLKQVRQSGP